MRASLIHTFLTAFLARSTFFFLLRTGTGNTAPFVPERNKRAVKLGKGTVPEIRILLPPPYNNGTLALLLVDTAERYAYKFSHMINYPMGKTTKAAERGNPDTLSFCELSPTHETV